MLVSDACATFVRGMFDAKTVHDIALASLDEEFANVVTTNQAVRKLSEV